MMLSWVMTPMSNNKSNLTERLSFIRFDEEAKQNLRSLMPIIEEYLPIILDEFYVHVGKYETTSSFFHNEAHMKFAN